MMNNQQLFQRNFQNFASSGQGPRTGQIFAGFSFPKMGNKPKTPTTPTVQTPLPPVTTPNPLDQPPGSVAAGPAAPAMANNPWLAQSPAMQPWMNNPMGGNPSAPQWGLPPQVMQYLQQMQQSYQQQPAYPTQSWGQSGWGQQPQIGGPLPPYNPSGNY